MRRRDPDGTPRRAVKPKAECDHRTSDHGLGADQIEADLSRAIGLSRPTPLSRGAARQKGGRRSWIATARAPHPTLCAADEGTLRSAAVHSQRPSNSPRTRPTQLYLASFILTFVFGLSLGSGASRRWSRFKVAGLRIAALDKLDRPLLFIHEAVNFSEPVSLIKLAGDDILFEDVQGGGRGRSTQSPSK